jgi:UV DNA damage endonuclease
VQVLGVTGLKSHDTRRWQRGPHLSVSLAYLRDVLGYLRRQHIHFYRISSELAPYATHPGMSQFHDQIPECQQELVAIGEMARTGGIRLSVHAGQYVVLNAPEDELAERAGREVSHQARLLEAMGLGPEGVVVLHVGGVYGDACAAKERFVRQVDQLPPATRSRLALENDDHRFSVDDCLWIHRETGLPLILDYLHFRCHNPQCRSLAEALDLCLNTWPADTPPKVHFSSPRTATVMVEQQDAMSSRMRHRTRAPRPSQHADYVDPFAFSDFLRTALKVAERRFDIMLEARARDLALLRLREQMVEFSPGVASRLS